MKMLTIVYNEAVDGEVMDVLSRCGLKNYTKILGVYGRGKTSGIHLGNDVWPGRNNLMYVACPGKEARDMLGCLRELKNKIGREGVKAFVQPLEDVL